MHILLLILEKERSSTESGESGGKIMSMVTDNEASLSIFDTQIGERFLPSVGTTIVRSLNEESSRI